MEGDSSSGWQGKGAFEELMRERIRTTIEGIIDEELVAALGAARSQRSGPVRVGYRHGKRSRTLTTSLGPTTIAMPRARLEGEDGRRREWRSAIIPRYQRRTERVDEAILGVYLSGTNTRRLRGALAPLLRGAPLSKDAVSRLVGRLREDFAAWAQRDLGELKIRYLFLDGWYPRMRIGKKRVRVPVLVTLGVCADGRRVVLDLRLAGVESANAWLDAVRSLGARNLGAPLLAVVDGNPGLAAALRVQWPQMALQRCTNHKLWNLLAKAPAHLREELAEDYRRMIYAESREAVEHARIGFARKWKLRCKTVSASFEEAGDELFANSVKGKRRRRRLTLLAQSSLPCTKPRGAAAAWRGVIRALMDGCAELVALSRLAKRQRSTFAGGRPRFIVAREPSAASPPAWCRPPELIPPR
jgi:putative transposase